MSRQGVLLVNLGSPSSLSTRDVRRYLREFLMDERVIDLPFLSRFLLVNCCILLTRPRKTAEAYRKIWSPEGAPLMVVSRNVQSHLQNRLDIPVALAMRYQQPSIESGIAQLVHNGVREIILVPLYPHYAMSSYETVAAKAELALAKLDPSLALKIVPPFYEDPDYIDALAASAADYLRQDFDHLLFSFHGVPVRHLHKTDPTGSHCLKTDNCCSVPSPAHRTCYRAQVFKTVAAFVKRTGLDDRKYSVAFQSRLGRDAWIEPHTDLEISRLASCGTKKLLVICPAFVADCLETLEEIGMRGRELFLQAGGENLQLIPCLNDHPSWINALENMIARLTSTVGSKMN